MRERDRQKETKTNTLILANRKPVMPSTQDEGRVLEKKKVMNLV